MIKTGFKPPKPLSQGDVSGDCVLYSALNAVRYLWPEEFTDLDACEALYGELVGSWSNTALVDILQNGTDSASAYQAALLMRDILFKRGLTLGLSRVTQTDRFEADAFFSDLRHKLMDLPEQAVAILGLDDPWNHWTVVANIAPINRSQQWIRFYDSYAPARLTMMRADEFTLMGEADRIMIDAAATVIYRRINTPVHA